MCKTHLLHFISQRSELITHNMKKAGQGVCKVSDRLQYTHVPEGGGSNEAPI